MMIMIGKRHVLFGEQGEIKKRLFAYKEANIN